MKKYLFESKKEFIEWLYRGTITVENVKESRREALAGYLGVTFYSKVEAGLSDDDNGQFAGSEHHRLSPFGERLPKRFPALLLLSAWKDSYRDLQFDHIWVYQSDFKLKRSIYNRYYR